MSLRRVRSRRESGLIGVEFGRAGGDERWDVECVEEGAVVDGYGVVCSCFCSDGHVDCVG